MHPSGLTLEELSGIVRVTPRSVRRYLEELHLLTELESVETRPGGANLWRIKPSERGRTVTLRRAQANALLATRRLFEVLRGTALFDEVEGAFRDLQILSERPQKARDKGEPLHQRMVFLPSVGRTFARRAEEQDELFRAATELRVLRCSYKEGDRTTRSVLHPYGIVFYEGDILCVAGGSFQEAGVPPRIFSFEKMSDVHASESEHFPMPDDFDLENYLHGVFGVHPPALTVHVVVEFDPRAADEVRARRFHPSQKVAVAPDGRVRLSLRLPHIEVAKSWVLSFGARARVIEPRSLARLVETEFAEALEKYR